MARRFRRRSGPWRRAVGGKRGTKWAAHVEEASITLEDPLFTNVHEILTPSDYASNDTFSPSGVTLLRIVGSLSFALAANSTNFDDATSLRVYWGFAVADFDSNPLSIDPSLPDALVKERWLRTGSFVWNGGDWNFGVTLEVDLRQKAILRDASVFFAVHWELINAVGAIESYPAPYQLSVRMLCRGDIT